MEKNYYVPTLDEFHVGFEFEAKTLDGSIYKIDEMKMMPFKQHKMLVGDLPFIEIALTGFMSKFKMIENVRVKCLDIEDVSEVLVDYPDFGLITGKNISEQIHIHYKGQSVFIGKIKNKSELKRLIKQL